VRSFKSNFSPLRNQIAQSHFDERFRYPWEETPQNRTTLAVKNKDGNEVQEKTLKGLGRMIVCEIRKQVFQKWLLK
jgi:hypothetical protein